MPSEVAALREPDISRMLADARIVRHRGKIEAVIQNARAYKELVAREGSLAQFAWRYAPTTSPLRRSRGDVPATSPEATAFSKELKRRGWRFVGPTTAYAFFQSMGLVNDHLTSCFRQAPLEASRQAALGKLTSQGR